MIVYGYKIMNATSLPDIEMVLSGIKKKIQQTTNNIYGELLGSEIALLCDNFTLNTLQRLDNKPIVNIAKESLEKKIHNARMIGASTKYNLSVFVQVFTYENEIYIKVTCSNPNLIKAFRSKDLKDVSLRESEYKDQTNPKTILWESIFASYVDGDVLSMNLSATPVYEKDKIVFPSVKDRAEMHARHTLMNRVMGQLGGNEPIPPFLLMPYVDHALELLTEDDNYKHELGEKIVHLEQILLDLEKENALIFGEEN